MPVSLAPISAELFADFRAGKETALEQVFRANFDALTKEAAARLNDVAAAQKVVAGALLDTWDRRAKPADAAALAALLQDAVSHGISHELRRAAAAHHTAHTGGAPAAPESLDQWWAKITGVLHAPKVDATEAAQRAAHSRHEAAAHMKKVAAPRRSGMYGVIVALLVIAAGVMLWYFNKGAESTKAGQLLGRDDAKALRSKDGQRGEVKLEDGVAVKIGSATTLKYTLHYPQDARAIFVSGTAEVTVPEGGSPLLVKVGNLWVYATGAQFLVRSFPEDSGSVMLKGVAGTASVKVGKVEKNLTAGSTMLVLSNGAIMDLVPEKAAFAFSWADGKFVSEHQPLRKVLTELKKWYAIEVTVPDTSFIDRPVLMSVPLDSTAAAIAALEEGASVSIAFEGTKRVLKDAAGMPKPAKKRK